MLAGGLLAATVLLVLFRPGGVGEAWWAVSGGLLAVALGLIGPGEALEALGGAREAFMLLAGMMLLGGVAERAGFFGWVAALAARAGGGRTWLLFVMVFLAGSAVTAGLSLDATAAVLTPIVCAMVARLGLRALPFAFACVYAANTASLFLPISNLTNLLAYDALDLGFVRFAGVMFLPGLLAVAVNATVLVVMFRSDLAGGYGAYRFEPGNPAFFRLSAATLAAVLAALPAAPVLGVPAGPVALAGGLGVAAVAVARGWLGIREAARCVPWGLLALVCGLFVVVRAAADAGLDRLLLEGLLSAPGGEWGFGRLLAVAASAALGANLLNNLPLLTLSLGVAREAGEPAAYALLIGTNVGPNLTLTGSLATLIWLGLVRERGVEVGAGRFLAVGLAVTPPVLLAATAGLWASLRLLSG
ncbi:arsenical pump membrane protein [Rubrobacter xylanophilus]|uniref:Arsenical pump membrane protein n=1 Tax=Rubrobacter xylanophilus TaxID=49319 RepID=A0A510HEX0_9ACTN|nr:SLC13 family permease [Rubrobacter xylanophilus]BBL78502.1 arsenical pump membrane protein [Rubrobacter xylanophilus]